KRDRFREVFAGFDPEVVAGFGPDDVDRLMADAGIVRNRAKIEATITNARAHLDLVDAEGSLDTYVWRFAPQQRPVPRTIADIPATSPESVAMSKDLKKRGWAFVGPTTVYAFQQAMGLVDDHLAGCWRRGGPTDGDRGDVTT
ncbi:MAG: DNA-3-methyladenine glycosylase I, partial [Egicoccus sp.]